MTDVNWAAVRAEMVDSPWEPVEDNLRVRRVFLGTCFSVMPSGKYYMPWAHGNVTDEEALADELFQEELEDEASEHGYTIEAGEGDPCDLFIAEYESVP